MRYFKAADLPRKCARVRTLLPTEQLALDEGPGNRCAVDTHHRSRPTRAELMNSGCEQFLSRAGLTYKEHAGVGGRHLFDLLQHVPKGSALADQARMSGDSSYLLLEIDVFALQLIAQAPHLMGTFPDCLFRARASDGAADHFHKEP